MADVTTAVAINCLVDGIRRLLSAMLSLQEFRGCVVFSIHVDSEAKSIKLQTKILPQGF